MTVKRKAARGRDRAGRFRLALIALMGSTALMTPSPVHAEFRNLGNATRDTLWYQANGVSGNGRFIVGEGAEADNADNQYSFQHGADTGNHSQGLDGTGALNRRRAPGQVVGLYGFDLGGGSFAETWVRAGADIDLKVTENAVISVSGHAATEGMDARISGAARFQVLF
ncbi:MAG: hypothetical protein DI528_04450 [Shinella sp.]|nr:MAG: hypothetical protein DI528_04450 [Shinella sp.]